MSDKKGFLKCCSLYFDNQDVLKTIVWGCGNGAEYAMTDAVEFGKLSVALNNPIVPEYIRNNFLKQVNDVITKKRLACEERQAKKAQAKRSA
jgi:hypothetical protein